jgi:hypothetical protein
MLNPTVELSEHLITNSEPSVQKLHTINLQHSDILVSFDAISLFTKVPHKETLQLLGQQFNNTTSDLLQQFLISTHFLHNDKFHNLRNGVTMGWFAGCASHGQFLYGTF